MKNEYDDVVLFLCIYKDITAQKEDLSTTTMFSGLSKFAKIAWSLNKYVFYLFLYNQDSKSQAVKSTK